MLLLIPGCGKGSKAGDTASAGSPTQALSTAAGVASQEPDLTEITRQLRRWIVRNQRPPKNFEDFAATANFQIPPPPAGKKYVIDKHMHVILVNR